MAFWMSTALVEFLIKDSKKTTGKAAQMWLVDKLEPVVLLQTVLHAGADRSAPFLPALQAGPSLVVSQNMTLGRGQGAETHTPNIL